MSNKTLYIIDFDGTILETTKLILKSREEICKEKLVHFDPSTRYPNEHEFLKMIFNNLTSTEIKHFTDLQIKYSYLAEDLNFLEIVKGLNLNIDNTVVVTRAFEEFVNHILRKNNFNFKVINVINDKLEVFKHLIESNPTYSDFVFIGDSINDLYFNNGINTKNILVVKKESSEEIDKTYKIIKPFNKASVLKLKNYLKIQ